MRIAILHNRDHEKFKSDPGRKAREDIERVASAVYDALIQAGHTVDLLPIADDITAAMESVLCRRPEVVVNLCESLNGDSRGEILVPGILNLGHLQYTGNTAFTLALALHKNKTKEILQARGVPTPEFWQVDNLKELNAVDLPDALIVKPSREDASVGIDFDSVVRNRKALGHAIERIRRTFKQPALVERFIEGREIYVPLLACGSPQKMEALPLTEIQFGSVFRDKPSVLTYCAKWEVDSQECLDSPSQPAKLSETLKTQCVEIAKAAFQAIEGRDYGRVDLRVDVNGQPWVIDINPNCDLHPQAGFSKAAEIADFSFVQLIHHLVNLAWERRHENQAPRRRGSRSTRQTTQPHRDILSGRDYLRTRTHRRSSARR